MKRLNKKGFTMAELLIVVAIIAVLVAIAIPIFTTQLEKSREATDVANIRSAYAEATVNALDNATGTGTATSVALKSNGDFEYVEAGTIIGGVDMSTQTVAAKSAVTVTVDDDGISTMTGGISYTRP